MSGERIGNYEVVRLLARGGMAVVYLVSQPALDRQVVLKRLDLETDDPALAQRFVREAQLAATLDHPNVVTLFDFFEDDGVPYIAMEYVAGGSLRSMIGKLTPPQIFGVVEGVLAGLGHAERQGIAHRDLKPENVLLTGRGSVKIADFGIARAYNALTHRLTTTGMAIGTPAYMAPEQALNERLGPYTDLYAVGIIVYELLAGRTPFDADTPVGLLYCHVHKPPPPLHGLLPRSQRGVCEWVEWLLAKSPSDRPQSAAEAWDALEEEIVAQLGPYWRRAAPITTPEPTAARLPAGRPDSPVAPPEDDEQPTTAEASASPPADDKPPASTGVPDGSHRIRRRRVATLAALALAGGAAAVALRQDEPRDVPPAAREPTASEPARTSQASRSATPYDFDGDGRQELVIALLHASPRGTTTPSGVVLLYRRGASGRAWMAITEARAGIRGRPRSDDQFGSGLASGDFDRDGHADLAIGTPGKNRVSVIYGSAAALLAGRTQQLRASRAELPPGAGSYGFNLLARDLNDDRFDDLVVSAPGQPPGEGDSGALHLVFGGEGGLRMSRARSIRPPSGDVAGFGSRIRSGDVDRDGHVDLVEGAPTRDLQIGHGSYCPGSRRGPTRCRALAAPAGTSSLAVADVNGDGYADIVQGDARGGPAGTTLSLSPGHVRLWLGGRRGPRRSPITITQNTQAIPDMDEPGDAFGAIVEADDVDADGFADMIVAATRENAGAGRITVIRGGRDGFARHGNSSFDQDDAAVPGTAQPDREFGSSITILSLSNDRRLDVAITARGENSADERVMVIEGGPGVFSPDETRTSTLPGVTRRVHAPRGGRIRLARGAGT